jgi:thiamine biosynthesis lipoprotein
MGVPNVTVLERPGDDGHQTAVARSTIAMDTFVTVHAAPSAPHGDLDRAMTRALAWFGRVERTCSRFDLASELVRLCRQPGAPVRVSDLLFEAVAFAVEVAKLTRGAFDPTVGGAQRARGFDRHYATQRTIAVASSATTYRDVQVNRERRTVTLRRPLLLDLGAVAKGLAIDLAARELAHLERFAVEAGGDIFAGGRGATRRPWRIGISSPERDGILGTLSVWNQAVCTSGGAERPAADGGHHLLDPRSGGSPAGFTSVTVIAPTALAADALSTAAFVLGPQHGPRLLADQDVPGVTVTTGDRAGLIPNSRGGPPWLPARH